MNHNSELRDFLKKNININSNRLDEAKKKVNPEDWTLISFIKNIIWDDFLWSSYQWSFWYHTIIKPNTDNNTWDYDVDVAIRLKYNSEYKWDESKYHDLLINAFKWSDRYKEKLDESKERAVRIQYDSNDWEFHVDLVPMFYNGDNRIVINKTNNEIEISWWNEFRYWVNKQNNKTSTEDSKSKYLKEVIRIFKYLRNKSNSQIIRSVQLTLLLWRQVDKLQSSYFESLWSSLYWIAKKLKEELENINELSELDLENPWLTGEYFNRNLDKNQFNDFKTWFIELSDKIIDAFEENEEKESLEKWKDVFWENFASNLSKNSIVLYDYNHSESITKFANYLLSPKKINIIWIKISKHNWKETPFTSSVRIPKNMILNFYALVDENIWNNNLIWQITNESNMYVKNKRWEINNAHTILGYSKKYRWFWIQEEWIRKWRHWVKCFLVDNLKNIIWESDEFIVNL